MRWMRLTDARDHRSLEGEELWDDAGQVFYGQYYYNANICTYVWNAWNDKGKAHTREEAKEMLLSIAVKQKLEARWPT